MDTLAFPASLFPPNNFSELRERYARFFVGDIVAPPPGWNNTLELALEEATRANESFSIEGLIVSNAGLTPVFHIDDSPSFRELLSEARFFCPVCGQSLPSYSDKEDRK